MSIEALASFVPDGNVATQDLPELEALPEQSRAVYERLGIETIRADDELGTAELAGAAARTLLGDYGLDGDDVDALVVAEGRVPEMLMASEAGKIQAMIGARRAVTFATGHLGCVSINAALIAARGMLASLPSTSRVLVVHGSKPPAPTRRFRYPVTINGDGGAAVLLSSSDDARHGRARILDMHLEMNGDYWDLFRVVFKDRPEDEWLEECKSLSTYSFQLAIESRNRFGVINESILHRNGLTYEKVEHFVMQNLSLGAFSFYEEAFGIRFAKACTENLRSFGHLGSMDILLNLHTGIRTGEFSRGDKVLIMNNSPVAAWASVLVEVN